MSRPLRALGLLLLFGAFPPLPWAAQEPHPDSPSETVQGEPATARELLDAIREDLVQLRFEKALAALEPLLVRPGLTENERIEAMVLRSQTHAAFGELDAAEEDYRQILVRRPSWSPDASLTPGKAMARYEKVRDKLIGRVRFVLDPADATLAIDGVEVPDTLQPIALLAGTHEVSVVRRGHDPSQQTIEVAAGDSVDLEISLIPNARTVILRTEPAGVEVLLDGVAVGRTERPGRYLGVGSDAAQLVLEDVPIGEHDFEFRKECYRTERLSDAINIDLLDRAPKRYDTVRLAESKAILMPEGGPAGTTLRVDGKPVATLPVDEAEACPGERLLEAVFEGRVLWSERRELTAAAPVSLALRARPNLVLVGMEQLPRELAALEPHVNLTSMSTPAGARFDDRAEWERQRFARGTDLAIAPAGGGRRGVTAAWWLYSPLLGTLERLVEPPTAAEPAWTVRVWGFVAADDAAPLVVERRTAGEPAVGSRLLSVGGRAVADAATLDAALRGADGVKTPATWRAPGGQTVEGELIASQSPWLRDAPPSAADDALRAAWAVVASESNSPDADAALANLALLLDAHGEHELAARTWRRVQWPERDGVGAGTVAYFLGRALQAAGRDREAVEPLRRAAASRGTAVHDGGPPVAPAARDRLADLGEAP